MVACFVKEGNNIFNIKEGDLNQLAQGGQLYLIKVACFVKKGNNIFNIKEADLD
jgi:hypothetical protein